MTKPTKGNYATNPDYDVAEELYSRGFCESDIAAWMGVSRQAVGNALHKTRGIPKTPRTKKKILISGRTQRDRAFRLYQKGVAIGIVPAHTCRSCKTISTVTVVDANNPLLPVKWKCGCSK